jgi:hypothetical protein
MEGIFSGKLIRANSLSKVEIPYGPLTMPKIEDPRDKLIKSRLGKIPYEANGAAQIPPDKIEFLGS